MEAIQNKSNFSRIGLKWLSTMSLQRLIRNSSCRKIWLDLLNITLRYKAIQYEVIGFLYIKSTSPGRQVQFCPLPLTLFPNELRRRYNKDLLHRSAVSLIQNTFFYFNHKSWGWRGEFSEKHHHGVTICTYEAAANVSDHKNSLFDQVNHQIQ